MEKTKELVIYPNDAGVIAKITINEKEIVKTIKPEKALKAKKEDIETIIILDVSGSMGLQVPRLFERILPKILLEKLGYKEHDKIYLVMFESNTTFVHDSIKNIFLSGKKYKALGGTCFLPALERLDKILDECRKRNIRLLTISDGEIGDQLLSVNFASAIAEKYKGKFNVNSQAVRYITTSNQPDTRALSSVLQFSTKMSTLADINMKLKDDEIIAQFEKLFDNDSFAFEIKLVAENEVFKQTPFSTAKSHIYLQPGENLFWITKEISTLPANEAERDLLRKELKFHIEQNGEEEMKEPVDIEFRDMNIENYWNVLGSKFTYFHQRLKILKIVNSKESVEEMENTIKYFEALEQGLERTGLVSFNFTPDDQENSSISKNSIENNLIANNNSENESSYTELKFTLAQRAEMLKKLVSKREKSISIVLSQIANDDKVSKLNSAQQAEYLRNLQVDKTAKGLAKRAAKSGFDFDEVCRKEVSGMALHLDEIADIDDSGHLISFYSNCSTLEGIKMCCTLEKDGSLNNFSALDILKLINIVGLACVGPIGNYPDPMIWNVNELFLGCYTSISDIMTVSKISCAQNNLKDISSKKDITNVIPLFDDERILKFLKKYAPNILEYSAGYGMRRVIALIPQTFNYTLAAGCWKMLQALNIKKSNFNLITFISMVKSYEYSIGNYFNPVLDIIEAQECILMQSYAPDQNSKPNFKSLYLANNGMNNMLSVLIKLMKAKKTYKIDYILRAIYSHEAYLVVKKMLKDIENPIESAKEKLNKLLGVDYKKYGTKLPEIFQEHEGKIKFIDKYFINLEMLYEFNKSSFFIDYICLLPDYLAAVYSENPLENLKQIPELTRKSVMQKLNIYRNKKFVNLFTESDNEEEELTVEQLNGCSSSESDGEPIYIPSKINNSDNKNHEQNGNANNEQIKLSSTKLDLLSKYKFYNFAQALIYHSQSLRGDEKQLKSFINDLIYMRKFEKELRKWVWSCYSSKYEQELLIKAKTEREILSKILIDALLEADVLKFKGLLNSGISRGNKSLTIKDSKQYAYPELIRRLADPSEACSFRFEKIEILAFGYDKSEGNHIAVFNNKVIMTRDQFNQFKEVYDKYDQDFTKVWKIIIGAKYLYREKPNRHGHHNAKPSFWALGYDSVLEMRKIFSKEEWEEYTVEHTNCCGIRFLMD